jgi:hypothetical protein
MKLIIFSKMIFIFLSLALAKETSVAHETSFFIHKKKPFFAFQYNSVTNWEVSRFDDATLRFNPGEKLNIMFEIPPALNITFGGEKESPAMTIKKVDEGKNAFGAEYKLVFLEKTRVPAYMFTLNAQKVYVENWIGDHSSDGLSGEKVLEVVKNSFQFLDSEKLTNEQIKMLIQESSFRTFFEKTDRNVKTFLDLSIDTQKDHYAVSLKSYKGGPLIHIRKKDLSVTKHPNR